MPPPAPQAPPCFGPPAALFLGSPSGALPPPGHRRQRLLPLLPQLVPPCCALGRAFGARRCVLRRGPAGSPTARPGPGTTRTPCEVLPGAGPSLQGACTLLRDAALREERKSTGEEMGSAQREALGMARMSLQTPYSGQSDAFRFFQWLLCT